MLYFIKMTLPYVFLFQPPILFYLRHKFKWRINSLLLALLSILLGWSLLFLLGLAVNSYSPGEGYSVQVFMVLLLCIGWFISGALLVFWSPVIVFFSTKNKKIKLVMGVVFLAFVSLIGLAHFSDRYDWGVPGNRLIHSGSTQTGFDGCSMLVFEAENDLLKQKMIRKWKLKPMTAYPDRSHPISFGAIGKDKPEWWPSSEVLDSLEGYGFIRDSDQRYRSLWYDPNNQRLYLERGNW